MAVLSGLPDILTMIELIKVTSLTVVTLAAGTGSIISDDTLIPLGIFAVSSVALVSAAWKVSGAVTRAVDRIQRIEERMAEVERHIKECPKR